MNAYLKKEMAGLRTNLANGIGLAFFRKAALPKFVTTGDQAVLLVVLDLLLCVLVDYLKYLPNPVFNVYALGGFCLQLLGLSLAAFALAKLKGDNSFMLSFFIQALSLAPLFYFLWLIMPLFLGPPYDYYGYLLWFLAVIAFILYQQVNRDIAKILTAAGAYS